ncbi:MAG: hypothetical protein SGJ27_25540 [Candidatus Melainabacteria bacterium]|nr:hypothetical protein [Candidatus Melainabacteria bacterium]
MEFRFPKARLFAYNKLAGGDSCYAVMVQAVTDAGLMSEDVAGQPNLEAEHGSTCGAIKAAEMIIRSFMHEHHDVQKAEELSNAAFGQIRSDLECWRQSVNVPASCKHFDQADACRDMTPIVLDLLLQQIMRH